MDLNGYRRMFRVLFFVGAMIVCFGIGGYCMEQEALGIILMIIGIAILVLSFSMTKFFLLFAMRNPQQRNGKS